MTTEQAKPTGSRKGKRNFSAKDKKEALRLIFEEKLTMRQAAAKIGCSVNSIQSWKAKHRSKKSKPSKGMIEPATVRWQPKEAKTVAFDDFVRNYWNEGTRAVDVLLLPSEIGPDVVRYVNDIQ